MANSGRSKGGSERAKRLTPEERAAIARKGAKARWEDMPQAVCGSPDNPLKIGGNEIQCFVLDDGTRVLSQADFLQALGRHRKANVRKEGEEEHLPAILQGKAINAFIGKELREKSKPIRFRTPSSARASGYPAEILPMVCEVYLQARDAGTLPHNQQHVAKQADILIRGLANVGIIALVDEATGYQEIRAKNALADILEAYIAEELRKWVRTFPATFFQQICRLKGYSFREDYKYPPFFGHIINDLVYKRMAPGILDELKRKNPANSSGNRRHKHHQWLTESIGHPRLLHHLGMLEGIAHGYGNGQYEAFKKHVDMALPRYDSAPLFLDSEEPEGTGEKADVQGD